MYAVATRLEDTVANQEAAMLCLSDTVRERVNSRRVTKGPYRRTPFTDETIIVKDERY